MGNSFLATLIFFLGAEALASEACTAAVSADHLLDFNVGSIIAPTYTEGVILKDGTTIEYSVGGCAHFGFRFQFSQTGLKPAKSGPDKITQAIALLKKVPIEKGKRNKAKELADMLDHALKNKTFTVNNEVITIQCGAAECGIEWTKEKATVFYSFAL